MTSPTSCIKQIAAGRRKPCMTRKEYFDHRFRVHGLISDGIEDKDQKPQKYIQTQIFDAAFPPRPNAPLNANHYWCGRDDTTELYFRDWNHVLSCFNSSYVKEKVGPDGPLFADFETSIVMMAREKDVSLSTRLAREKTKQKIENGKGTVAMYFVAAPDGAREGAALERNLSPVLTAAFEEHCQDEVWRLAVNVGEVSEHFDLNAYFGGADAPQYALVYKIYLKGPASVPAVRRSQKAFESKAGSSIDSHNTFIVFAEEALIMDVAENVRFSLDRQPIFQDLPGPSHLD